MGCEHYPFSGDPESCLHCRAKVLGLTPIPPLYERYGSLELDRSWDNILEAIDAVKKIKREELYAQSVIESFKPKEGKIVEHWEIKL